MAPSKKIAKKPAASREKKTGKSLTKEAPPAPGPWTQKMKCERRPKERGGEAQRSKLGKQRQNQRKGKGSAQHVP